MNQTSVGHNVSDLEISLGGMLTGSPTHNGTQTNTTATVASNGTFTAGMTTATWALSSPISNQISLDALGAGPQTPAFTLLGAPGPSGYSNTNGSIAGNGPHNPFFLETATFSILVPGVTASTAISGVTFSFGTTPGVMLPGTPSVVPLPGAFLLFGSVLFGGLGVAKSRKQHRGPVSVIA